MIKLDKSLINTIEAFLLTAGRPLTVSEIRDLLNEKEESIELGKIRQTLGEIEEGIVIRVYVWWFPSGFGKLSSKR